MKHYQLVVKGIASNKIAVIDFENYKEFKDALKRTKNCDLMQIITTNQYIEI